MEAGMDYLLTILLVSSFISYLHLNHETYLTNEVDLYLLQVHF